MTAHREVLMPMNVAIQAIGGADFYTQIVESGGGHEQRSTPRSRPKWKFTLSSPVIDPADVAEFEAFILAVTFGRLHSFLLKDHKDFQIADWQEIEQSGGATHQLVKDYTYGGFTFLRTITKPQQLRVSVNGLELVEGPGAGKFQFSTTTGIITLGTATSSGDLLEVICPLFYVPVRFADDFNPGRLLHPEIGAEYQSIEMIEVFDV